MRMLSLSRNDVTRFIKGKNGLNYLFGIVYHLSEFQVLCIDHPAANHGVSKPLQQALPERSAYQYHRNMPGFASLYQDQYFREFIERAKAA